MFWKESMRNVKQMSCKRLWGKCFGKNDGDRKAWMWKREATNEKSMRNVKRLLCRGGRGYSGSIKGGSKLIT